MTNLIFIFNDRGPFCNSGAMYKSTVINDEETYSKPDIA